MACLADFVGDLEPPRDELPRDIFLELRGDAIPLPKYQGAEAALPASRVPGVALILNEPLTVPGLAFVPLVYTHDPFPLSVREGVREGVLLPLGVPPPGVPTYWLSAP